MSDKCENIIPGTNRTCGDEAGPFQIRFCSPDCAKRSNQKELDELGITPEMLREALDGYYECVSMIERREKKTSE